MDGETRRQVCWFTTKTARSDQHRILLEICCMTGSQCSVSQIQDEAEVYFGMHPIRRAVEWRIRGRWVIEARRKPSRIEQHG